MTEPIQAQYFAVTAPGLAPLVAQELQGLGLAAEPEAGGAAFSASLDGLYRANLGLRTASRVLLRLGDFYAISFPELRKRAALLEWERFLRPGQPVALHVTCHKSRLYHSGAVAERVLAAIGDHLGRPSPAARPPSEDEPPQQAARPRSPKGQPKQGRAAPGLPHELAPQLVIVRLDRDHCTISVDSSGGLLHRRGYRLAVGKAPLRETLAAAMLLAAGWNGAAPLLDPFCGSGTIAIEAALLALGRPPGCARRFACQDWPTFDHELWRQARAACEGEVPAMPRILASDRDAGAVRMAQANAERAGVAQWIEFSTQAVSAVAPPPELGWVVTNPPYGLRVSAGQDLRNLYAQFGIVLRAACPGWQVAVLSSEPRLLGQIGFPLETALTTVNGGVSVRLARGSVPGRE